MDGDTWDPVSSRPFLIITTNSQVEYIYDLRKSSTGRIYRWRIGFLNEWNSHKLPQGLFLNMTLCSAGFNPRRADVELVERGRPVRTRDKAGY